MVQSSINTIAFLGVKILKGDFLDFFMYDIQHCFICRLSDSTVSKDAEIEPRTVAITALAVRCSRCNDKGSRICGKAC